MCPHPLSSMALYTKLPSPFRTTPTTKPSLSLSTFNNLQTLSKVWYLLRRPLKTLLKMAKNGKLTKLKSAMRKWPSFTKLTRTNSAIASTNQSDDVPKELHPVYVGKSRRRYLVGSEIIDHPLFQELVDKSGEYGDGVAVACEVVLFEHLLWMLENAETQLGSMDELVEFYTC